jgi:ribonuclease Z
MLKAWQRLDRGRMNCELIGVKSGDVLTLSREHRVARLFPTTHTVPSVGYIVYDVRKKLKPEFHGLKGDQIRDLKFQGIEVAAEFLTPMLAFTGDTSPAGLDAHPDNVHGRSADHGDDVLSGPNIGRKRSISSGTCIWTIFCNAPKSFRTN